MLITGAKGHAIEILEILTKKDQLNDLYFYDDVSEDIGDYLYNKFRIIRSVEEVKDLFKKDNRYILGLGKPELRHRIAKKFNELGGKLTSIISHDAYIGSWNCMIEAGVNIMPKTFISNDTTICEGALINTGSQIHHGTYIGRYSEISPHVSIAGNCKIEEFCSIGIGAVILPNIQIGKNTIVGAGSVVTKNSSGHEIIFGVPAKQKRLK
jgi:sugar O-acyltransferase (sialic acid O-acetyltransferase NeuD family)